MSWGSLSRVRRGLCDLRETLALIPVALRGVIHETRDLAQLLWVEHEHPAGTDPALLDAPKETRERWWQVAAAALKAMRHDPEAGPDQAEPSLNELTQLIRVVHARALDRNAAVPDPSLEDLDEWERIATLTLAWWAKQASASGAGADEPD